MHVTNSSCTLGSELNAVQYLVNYLVPPPVQSWYFIVRNHIYEEI